MSQTPTQADARVLGLSAEEFDRIAVRLGRPPTKTELGMIAVMWSEHCSYKSSRLHLRRLPKEGPHVLAGPGENAGVIDVGDGVAVAFKIESHNHPSYIEPFQGAATGVGGIMRDVFTMGARPIANMNSLRFGDLGFPRMKFLVEGVVAGIGSYGNCMGVPTVGGDCMFDTAYDENILVNAFTLGVLSPDRIFRSSAAGVGNDVVYVGSKTGRDGIHGATMASEEFSADTEAKRPRVQVGDPFTEKKLLEACLELMAEDVVVAIQDMGAAGLTSTSSEMAAKGGVGIEIDVAKVPRRESGMTPDEVMLSESQERMLMVIREGRGDVVSRIFAKWDLDAAVIGKITTSGKVVIKDGSVVAAEIPAEMLAHEAPLYDRPRQRPALESRWTLVPFADRPAGDRLLELLARPTIASKRWIFEQFDATVRVGTVRGPGRADAAVIRMTRPDGSPSSETKRGLAMTVDVNGRLVELDPRRGAALTVLEAACNLACVGAEPRGISDCLNFGNPERPETMWAFSEAIDGIADAARALSVPVISGNVSLYNETNARPIFPTPTVAMVGVVEDIERVGGVAFRATGDHVFVVGDASALSLAGSELQRMESYALSGRPADPRLDQAVRVQAFVRDAIRSGLASSAHDVSEGGLLVCLAECAVAGRVGANVDAPSSELAALFGEGPSVVVISAPPSREGELLALATKHASPLQKIGAVGGTRLVVRGIVDLAVDELADRFEHGLPRALGAAPKERGVG